MTMIKVFAFDLDGTLTQHKTKLDCKNRAILEKLSANYKLLMVGAGNCHRIHDQLDGFPIDIIGNYGMQYAKYQDGDLRLVRDDKIFCDRHSAERNVSELREKYGFTAFSGEGVEFHESGCVTFPILGTKAVQVDKLAFDPDRKKRRAIYSEVCDAFSDYNVFVGGSSSFDMAPKPYNKYYALDLWCKENGFSHDEVVFVGDDYGLGGNDESVYRSDFRFITIDDYTRLFEILAPWIDESVPDVTSMLGEKSDCPCGKHHSCEILKVLIRNGALNELPAMTADFNRILLVCDENTYKACARRVESLLGDKISSTLIYESDGFLVPNEEAVAKLESFVIETTDLIVGVGSGVINDLCKYVSYKYNLPYYIVATAPSMDGYASKGAAMLFGGIKITTTARVPAAIIADTEILKDAPIEMLKAGYGDIIGKYSCLNDWRLAQAVTGETLCDFVYNLTYSAVESISKKGRAILEKDENAVEELMRALVIVGIAMAYVGNSRPASGSEHHLSHFFEVVGLLRGEPYFCHGIDVAYSTYVTAKIREKLLTIKNPLENPFNETAWENNIKSTYSKKENSETADGIIELQRKLGWIYRNRVPVYRKKWNEICDILSHSPSAEDVRRMLFSVELPISDFEQAYGAEKLNAAINYAKYLKDRYTVLWLYTDIKQLS